MSKLTVLEALEQGYTHCGWNDKDWQVLHKLEDMNQEDFNDEFESGELVLAAKDPKTTTITKEQIGETLAELMLDLHSQQCADDTDEVYDLVKELNFEQAAEMINKKLESKKYWDLTDIKLVP